MQHVPFDVCQNKKRKELKTNNCFRMSLLGFFFFSSFFIDEFIGRGVLKRIFSHDTAFKQT